MKIHFPFSICVCVSTVTVVHAKVYKGEENYFFEPPVEPFAVDDPNWKPKTFKLGHLELEDTWGFVDKSVLPLNHHGYEEVMELCGVELRTQSKPLYTHSKFGTLNYYVDTPNFRKWKGYDLIPENKDNYVRGAFTELDYKFKEELMPGEDVTFSRCQKPRKDTTEGGWITERVGPFYSTGGYDWWQFGWNDVGGFKEILEKYPEGIDVDVRTMEPVDEQGRRIGHPPIHIHHVHCVPDMGVRPRNRLRNACATHKFGFDSKIKEENCYNSSLVFEQHGDYQCKHEDDGMECLTLRDMRRIDQPLSIEGELNDVRPKGSERIKWYYQVSFCWRPRQAEEKPISQMTIMAPPKIGVGDGVLETDQLDRTATFVTPTHAEHMLWYQGRLWADGTLVRNKLHAHNQVFESSEFFIGTPKDLGLDKKKFMPRRAYEPLGTADLGFTSNDHFRKFLFDNLEEAQRKFDQNCVKRENPADESCGRPRPRLVCAALYAADDFEFDDGNMYAFDRRPLTHCTPWKFREGDAFTVTGFSRHLTKPTKPDQPGYIPAFIPGHVSWHFWYHHDGWDHSFFGRIICNQAGIWFSAAEEYGVMKLLSMGSSVLWEGGIPRGFGFQTFVVYLLTFSTIGATIYTARFMFIKQKKA